MQPTFGEANDTIKWAKYQINLSISEMQPTFGEANGTINRAKYQTNNTKRGMQLFVSHIPHGLCQANALFEFL